MKVKTLRIILESVLEDLKMNCYDEEEVVVHANTYTLRGCCHFLATRNGYINLDEIEIKPEGGENE